MSRSARVLDYWTQPQECCNAAWERAYARFETPEEEVAKFMRRLRRFGVEGWSRDLQIVEIFCGQGGGLVAWERLGFRRLEGVDISEGLLRRYEGDAQLYVGDCRSLRLPDASRDVITVQGGLHHLPTLPGDMEATVAEAWRVLRPGGCLMVVEPWRTPFLTFAHWVTDRKLVRRISRKSDALAAMTEQEHATYFNWLARPQELLGVLTARFATEQQRIGWGKLCWLGRKRT